MKFKVPNKDFIKISLDRLTRFKPVEERYSRVFEDILNKYYIFDGGCRPFEMNLEEKIQTVQTIFNSAFSNTSNYSLNDIIKQDEEKIFYLSETEKKFLNSKIDFEAALQLFSEDELPLNLKRLKLQREYTSNFVRKKYSTLYPVSKVVLTEGITEEILLIEFAKILGLDFKKEGIYVIGAGGKNQAAKKYYKLIEEIKIPVFVLLDCDADEICNLISRKLRVADELYKIKSGEFEDILPKNLIKNALNYHFAENLPAVDNDFEETGHAVFDLNECYKNNGWGEFKKAGFAKIIREYLLNTENPPVSDELKFIITRIGEL